jgi:catechol 2,3-dioxygenase-like lactoylglutathione lyase family enzyme
MKEKKFYKVTPFLPVRDLRETLNFYRDELGFSNEWTWGDNDGGIQRDEMRLLFGQNTDYVRMINNAQRRFELVWFVDNVDEIYNEFKVKKKLMTSEIKNEPWGIREFTFQDINGYLIRISETIK